jgi:hypothetical protein
MPRSHGGEVSVVEGCILGEFESFGDGDHGGAEREPLSQSPDPAAWRRVG